MQRPEVGKNLVLLKNSKEVCVTSVQKEAMSQRTLRGLTGAAKELAFLP